MQKPSVNRSSSTFFESAFRGATTVFATAVLWGGLSHWLYANGESPGGPTPFENHFEVQRWLILPVLLFAWAGFCSVLWLVCGRGSLSTSPGVWFESLGGIYGNGYMLCWVLPDAVAYGLMDMQGLRALAPVLPLLTTGFIGFLSFQFVVRRVQMHKGRIGLGVLLAWTLQSIPLLFLIR